MLNALWVAVTYVIGSIPFGLVYAKTFCGIDPRLAGSNSVGSTNVARLCGKKWGAITLVCDVLKGALPVCVALYLVKNQPEASFMGQYHGMIWVTLTALAAIGGHVFSCFLGFKGGKAVATSIGVLAPLAFWQLLVACLLCVAVIWRSGFVSLGSLSLVAVFPLLLLCFGPLTALPLALIITAFVFWSHRQNIRRLLKGQENTWIKKH